MTARPFFRPMTTKPRYNLRVGFHTTRCYSGILKPVTVFGKEGAGDEDLCRPWGVCCDSRGHVIVADRSNNRIHIFRSDGTHVRSFGCFGSKEGELNKPAGIAVDLKGRIVVCDKDNHRVQVFSIEGEFIFAFGSRGSAHGTFEYPWDVAVNPLTNEYAISDHGNRCVQIFTESGEYLTSFGFAPNSPMWETVDEPRGLWFTPEGNLLVTDFNAHRVFEVQYRKVSAYRWQLRMVNMERYRQWKLKRPQKVIMDQEGNILVSDYKNNRIQVFDRDGICIACIGVGGSEPGQFNGPCGMAFTTDRNLVVVDFGNHRIQIF
jgi:tripartite motif-containing protein 71